MIVEWMGVMRLYYNRYIDLETNLTIKFNGDAFIGPWTEEDKKVILEEPRWKVTNKTLKEIKLELL